MSEAAQQHSQDSCASAKDDIKPRVLTNAILGIHLEVDHRHKVDQVATLLLITPGDMHALGSRICHRLLRRLPSILRSTPMQMLKKHIENLLVGAILLWSVFKQMLPFPWRKLNLKP